MVIGNQNSHLESCLAGSRVEVEFVKSWWFPSLEVLQREFHRSAGERAPAYQTRRETARLDLLGVKASPVVLNVKSS